ARACARFLKLIRYNTQDILEAFWIFRIALGRIPPEGLIVEAQSASFSVRSTDLMDLKVALVGAHEFEVTDFVNRHLVSDAEGAFIDVGANIGYFSIITGRGSRPVVAIEPSPRNLLSLRGNLSLNGLEHVHVVEKAAWSESAKHFNLHVPDRYNFGANTLLDAGLVECVVETITVDEVVRALDIESIEIIKIDVEGGEYEVLRGMRTTLKGIRPRYIVCALDHPNESRRCETGRLLAANGYQEIDFESELPVRRTNFPRATVLFRAES